MATQFVKIGLIYTINKYIVLGINFVRGIIIANVLGPEALGTYALIILILEYLNYSNLGIFFSMNREISITIGEEGKEDYMQAVLNNSLSFAISMSLFFLGLFLIVYLFFSEIVPQDIYKYLSSIYILMLIYQAKTFLLTYFRLFDKYLALNLVELLTSFFMFLGIYVFIEEHLIDAVIASTVIANGVIIVGALFLVSSFKLQIKYSLLKFLIYAGIPMLLFNLFVQLLTSVDRLMLSNLVSRISLGHYHFGYLLSMGIFAAFNSIAFLFIPKWFKQFHQEGLKEEKVALNVKFQTSIAEIAVIVLSIIGIILLPLVLRKFLPEYESSILVSQLLLFGYCLNAMGFFPATFLLSNNHQIKLLPLIILIIFIAVILNLMVLNFGYGIYGIAFVTSLAFGAYSLGIFSIMFYLEEMPILKNLVEVFWKFGIFFPLSFIVLWENFSTLLILLFFILIYGKEITTLVKKYYLNKL